VLEFLGPRLQLSEVIDFSRVIQIGDDLFLGSSHDIDDYVNHSCDPNCGAREESSTVVLIALQDIHAGDEITFDYSTCMLDEPWLLECACGSARCRGRISRFHALPPSVKARYLALCVVPTFVARLERLPLERRARPRPSAE